MNPRSLAQLPLLRNGFVDVPKIVKEGATAKYFPGILPDIEGIRKRDFPLFEKGGRIYLDSGATSQEPRTVIDRMHLFRLEHLRGSNHSKNSLEARIAQQNYDSAKEKLKRFFNAHSYDLAFTSGTTGSSNLLATRFAYDQDTLVLVTEAEHNSQIVTARNFADATGARFGVLPVNRDGSIDLNVLEEVVRRFGGRILLNLVHVSNVTGAVNDVKKIRELVGDQVVIYLDMAQSAGHIPINLDSLGVDFASASAHKMYGPTGIGAFFVSKRGQRYLTDLVSGGSAVHLVTAGNVAYAGSPERFEPGTQNIEGAIEWGYAVDYLSAIGMERIAAHDEELGRLFSQELAKVRGLDIYSPMSGEGRVPIFVFNSRSHRHTDLARILDEHDISVRDGCFCAHILVSRLLGKPPEVMELIAVMFAASGRDASSLPGAVRASLAFYNNLHDVHRAALAINEIIESRW
ncbi:MAG: aminotransferase class V-fold PLP-dependent enzyme [Candidatus Micrarchaeota archaeon]